MTTRNHEGDKQESPKPIRSWRNLLKLVHVQSPEYANNWIEADKYERPGVQIVHFTLDRSVPEQNADAFFKLLLGEADYPKISFGGRPNDAAYKLMHAKEPILLVVEATNAIQKPREWGGRNVDGGKFYDPRLSEFFEYLCGDPDSNGRVIIITKPQIGFFELTAYTTTTRPQLVPALTAEPLDTVK